MGRPLSLPAHSSLDQPNKPVFHTVCCVVSKSQHTDHYQDPFHLSHFDECFKAPCMIQKTLLWRELDMLNNAISKSMIMIARSRTRLTARLITRKRSSGHVIRRSLFGGARSIRARLTVKVHPRYIFSNESFEVCTTSENFSIG